MWSHTSEVWSEFTRQGCLIVYDGDPKEQFILRSVSEEREIPLVELKEEDFTRLILMSVDLERVNFNGKEGHVRELYANDCVGMEYLNRFTGLEYLALSSLEVDLSDLPVSLKGLLVETLDEEEVERIRRERPGLEIREAGQLVLRPGFIAQAAV